MNIKGFLKSSFIDYPDRIASVIFLGGCNFRCPYCHNGDLVMDGGSQEIAFDEIKEHFQKRRGIIENVVVTGGEPTIDDRLYELLRWLKGLGLSVKLDTNGSNPQVLEGLVKEKLVDYIAMDIKNSWDKYAHTIGLNIFNYNNIRDSIAFIESSGVDYEFRTTLVKELHSLEDIIAIGKQLKPDSRYVLQQYSKSEEELTENNFSFFTLAEMDGYKAILETEYGMKSIEVKGRY